MKTHSFIPGLILVFAAVPLALTAAAQRGPRGLCNGTGPGGGACLAANSDTAPLTLSEEARTALLFQIDEERMARELYATFGAKWGLPTFTNIAQSEARHESSLRQLATRAGLALPTAVAGRFDSAEVQKRFDDLLALGLASADSALRVGAYVEEVDLADLDTLMAASDHAAVKAVATAQKRASGQHLKAFAGVLASRGITYTPQVPKPEDYQALVASGGNGYGRGQGQGQGRGQGWRGGQSRGQL